MKPTNLFQDSVVAFADALGTKNSATLDQLASEFLAGLKSAASDLSPHIKMFNRIHGIQVRWFSDSIVMSCQLGERGTGLLDVVRDLTYVQAVYASHGIFLRGAIVRGPHYHDAHIDYGSALVEATELEKKGSGNAVRIVLSGSLLHDIQSHSWDTLNNPRVVVDESDDTAFLHFLGLCPGAILKSIRNHIETSYNNIPTTDPIEHGKIQAKLQWFGAYFNWFVGNRQLKFAPPIAFKNLQR
jgi:hypothetical protein